MKYNIYPVEECEVVLTVTYIAGMTIVSRLCEYIFVLIV